MVNFNTNNFRFWRDFSNLKMVSSPSQNDHDNHDFLSILEGPWCVTDKLNELVQQYHGSQWVWILPGCLNFIFLFYVLLLSLRNFTGFNRIVLVYVYMILLKNSRCRSNWKRDAMHFAKANQCGEPVTFSAPSDHEMANEHALLVNDDSDSN